MPSAPVRREPGDILVDFARKRGLWAGYDRVGNFTATLADEAEAGCDIIIGSHINSVPRGGNFDGLAGVIAGLGVLLALQSAKVTAPAGVLRVLGFRGEESPWFGTAYLGNKLFLGQLPFAERERLRRFDTGRSLNQHLQDLGVDIASAGRAPVIALDRLKAYFELHIEQAPLLEAMGRPVGNATAIRGNIRYPVAKCFGEYAHSGAVPRHLRSDAVVATAKLIAFADEMWRALIDNGKNDDLVFTAGILQTNSGEHAMTKVPGEVTFALNVGGTDNKVMQELHAAIINEANRLAEEHRVRFELGDRVGTEGILLDERIISIVEQAGKEVGLAPHLMPTVGHDAAMFARAGVMSAVILVRNQNGSHNPEERMEFHDFISALKLMCASVMALA